MRVHVTGGSGFTGGHVIPLLIERGYEVLALARSQKAANRVAEVGAKPVMGNLDDPPSLRRAFAEGTPEALVNLASLGFGQAPAVLEAVKTTGLKRGVYVSSTAIYTTIDAQSKLRRLAGEQTVTESNLDWTVIRPTMIYGAPGDRNIERLLRLLRWTPIVPLPGGGKRLQQPVHVDDLSQAIVAALERPESIRQAYDIAGPDPLTLRQIVEHAAAALGRSPMLPPIPLNIALLIMRGYERIAKRPRLRTEQLDRLAEDKSFSIRRAAADLGFRPRSFSDGLRHEIDMIF